MPWTLYRYILKDLVKVLALATAVLVVVIAVAAAIKPLSDGLLGPVGLIKFVLYSVPTMLSFALPFGAAFAGTMVFCRLTNDNEIVACSAGGMSYRTILLPVFFLGFVLTLSLFYLSNWVVPTFYLMAEHQLETDITKAVISQIKKRQPFVFGSTSTTVLYADAVDDSQPPPLMLDASGKPAAYQPKQLIMLQGVAVERMDEHGLVRFDATAQRADVLVYNVGSQTWMTMRLINAIYASGDGKHFVYLKTDASPQFRLPSPFQDRVHFLSWPELQALGDNPEGFDEIASKKQRLVDAMATDIITSLMVDALDPRHGRGSFTLQGTDGPVVVSAPRLQRQGNNLRLEAAPGAKVTVGIYSNGALTRRLDANEAYVTVSTSEDQPEPQIQITLKNLTIYDPRLGTRAIPRTELSLPQATWPDAVEPDLISRSAARLLEAAQDPAPSQGVAWAAKLLDDRIGRLARQIIALLHGRAASAVDCMLVLMLGAVLSLVFRGSSPLVVYFWAFILATVAVVIARSGENVASESSRHLGAGLLVIWSGNLLLLAVVAGSYLRLRKN